MFYVPHFTPSPRRQDLKYLWAHVKNKKSRSFLDKIQMKLVCTDIWRQMRETSSLSFPRQ
jgi:hypothetical protein